MNGLQRLAAKAFGLDLAADVKPGAEYIDNVVRIDDVRSSQFTTTGRLRAMELVGGFTKWVAIANARNSAAVAGQKLRLYRTSRKSVFQTKSLSLNERARLFEFGPQEIKTVGNPRDIVEVVDPFHPVLQVLRQVNPWMNGFEFLEYVESDQALTGDAFTNVVSSTTNGWPTQLWPMHSQFVDIQPDQKKFISVYRFGRDVSNMSDYAPETVIQFSRPHSTGNPYRGFGDLEKCLADANLSVDFTTARQSRLDNGVDSPLTVVLEKGATRNQARQMQNDMAANKAGVKNFGKPTVLWGIVKELINNGLSEGEVAFLKSDDAVREVVAGAHDMPVALLTLTPGALGNKSQALEQWYRLGVLPRCTRISEKLNERFIPLFANTMGSEGQGLILAFDSPVREDLDAQAVRLTSLKKSGIITTNEAREKLDLPPMDGGDELVSETTSTAEQDNDAKRTNEAENQRPGLNDGETIEVLVEENNAA